MYSDTKIYDNTAVTVKSKANLDKFKGFYPQDEYIGTLVEYKIETFTETCGDNRLCTWNVVFSKGEKYELVNNKFYKYSLVEWKENKFDTLHQWSKKVIDASIFDARRDYNGIYVNSYIHQYISKVMLKKMLWAGIHNLDLTFIENKQTTVEYELYNVLNPKYFENNIPEDVTDYSKAMVPVYKQIRLNDPSFVWEWANPDHAWTRTYHQSLTHTPVLIIPDNGYFEWSRCWQLRGIRPSIF